MKLRFFFIGIIIFALAFGQTNAQNINGKVDSLIVGMTESICQVTPLNTEFAYAVIKEGKVHFYGFKNQPLKKAMVVNNENAVFEIGSISKIFTTSLLADLILKEKLNYLTTVGPFFDNKMKQGNELTLIQLSNHSSGVPSIPTDLPTDIINPYKDYTYNDILNYVQQDLELNQTGTYNYSNLGMAMLEYCIAQTSQKSYEEYIQELICKPLKMQHTTSDYRLVKESMVQGLDSAGNPTAHWDMNAFVGAGGVLSTVSDLSKMALAYMDESIPALNHTLTKTLEVNAQMYVGLGWHCVLNPKKQILNFHNGGTNGYGSTMIMDLENKNAIIILTNLSAFSPYFAYIDKTAINILGKL